MGNETPLYFNLLYKTSTENSKCIPILEIAYYNV